MLILLSSLSELRLDESNEAVRSLSSITLAGDLSSTLGNDDAREERRLLLPLFSSRSAED